MSRTGRLVGPPAVRPGRRALRGPLNRRRLLVVAAAVGVAVAPVVVAWWQVRGYWVPTGDSALVTLRSTDVFSADTPLVGMPSTAGPDLHHPGPIQFQTIALFDLVLPTDEAALAASAATTVTFLGLLVVLVARRTSVTIAAGVAGLVAIVAVSLSSEPLTTPFNPYSLVAPLAAFLVASVVLDDRFSVLVWVVAGTFAAQVHLTGFFLVGAVAALVLAHRLLTTRRQDARATADPLLGPVPLVVAAVLWLAPAADAFAHRGGNLRRIAAAVFDGDGDPTIGAGRALRIAGEMFEPIVPVWVRHDPRAWDLYDASTGLGVVMLLVIAATLLIVVIRSDLRTDRPRTPFVALTGLAAGILLLSRIPDDAFNTLALHNYLWMWAVGPFVAICLLASLLSDRRRQAIRAADPTARPGVLAAGAAVGIGIVAWAAAVAPSVPGDRRSPLITEDLTEQLADTDADATYVMASSGELEEFAVVSGVAVGLDLAGLEVGFAGPLVDAVGSHREVDNHDDVPAIILGAVYDHTSDGSPCPAAVLAEHRPDPEIARIHDVAVAELVALLESDPSLAPFAPDDLELFVATGLIGSAEIGLVDPAITDTDAYAALESLAEEAPAPVYLVDTQRCAQADS